MQSWRRTLEGKALACVVDTHKRDVGICCPAFWQHEFKTWFDGQDILKVFVCNVGLGETSVPDYLNGLITCMRTTLAYAGACKKAVHPLGHISFVPNASDFKAADDWSIADSL